MNDNASLIENAEVGINTEVDRAEADKKRCNNLREAAT